MWSREQRLALQEVSCSRHCHAWLKGIRRRFLLKGRKCALAGSERLGLLALCGHAPRMVHLLCPYSDAQDGYLGIDVERHVDISPDLLAPQLERTPRGGNKNIAEKVVAKSGLLST